MLTYASRVDWLAIAPPLATAVAVLLALVVGTGPRAARRLAPTVAVAGLAAGLGFVLALARRGGEHLSFCAGGDPAQCAYRIGPSGVAVQAVVLGGALIAVLLSMPAALAGEVPPEYQLLVLASATGAAVIPAAADFVGLIVALETASVPVFVLAGIRRRDPRSAEAALTIFLVGVVSTAITVFGIAMAYGATGSLTLTGVADGLARLSGPMLTVGQVAAVLVTVGFAFKVAAVPFHAWAPDTYVGAPVPVAAFLAVVSKTAGFAGVYVVLGIAFRPVAATWGTALAIVAVATMTVANVAALRQRSVVRVLAWSSVAQSGYILLPLGAAATAAGREHLDVLFAASLAYLAAYAAFNIGAFAVAVAIGRERPRLAIDDLRGLARSQPWLAAAWLFFLTCLAGLPPGLVGLFVKVAVFTSVVAHGAWWLGLALALNVVVALAYYARLGLAAVVPAEGAAGRPARALPVPGALVAALTLVAAVTVVLSVWPQAVLRLLT